MIQQSVTRESLNQLLRSFSHKRRNGVLGVEFEQRSFEIAFREGKIVGVADLRSDAALELCRKLAEADYISANVLQVIAGRNISISQLGELLVGKGYVSQDDFVRAKQAFEMDLLYSLAELEKGLADFRPQLVRYDPRSSIQVFPAQLMLDLEELNADRIRLLELFDPEHTLLLKEEPPVLLTDGERTLLAAAGSGGNVEAVLRRCLMSQYEAIEALLSLYDQEVLVTSAKHTTVDEPESFEDFQSSAIDALDSTLEENNREESEIEDKLEVAEKADEVSAEPQGVAEQEHSAHAESDSAHLLQQGEVHSASEKPSRTGLKGVIKAGSYHLLHPDVVNYIIFFATTALLITLGLIGPRMFETWFDALAAFSSYS